MLSIGYQAYEHYQPGYVYLISMEGEQVGKVRDEYELKKVTKHLIEQERQEVGFDVAIGQEISKERVFSWNPEIHLPNLQQQIAQRATYVSTGIKIKVDEEPVTYVESNDVAEEIIEKIKEYYIKTAEGELVSKPEIISDITFESVAVEPDEIMDFDSAKSILLRGTERLETYTVSRGDTLSDIASKVDMTVSELKEANQLDSDIIQLNQKLDLVVAEPHIDVVQKEKITSTETIPYSTQWSNNSNLWYFQTNVSTPGQSGIRENTYLIKKLMEKK